MACSTAPGRRIKHPSEAIRAMGGGSARSHRGQVQKACEVECPKELLGALELGKMVALELGKAHFWSQINFLPISHGCMCHTWEASWQDSLKLDEDRFRSLAHNRSSFVRPLCLSPIAGVGILVASWTLGHSHHMALVATHGNEQSPNLPQSENTVALSQRCAKVIWNPASYKDATNLAELCHQSVHLGTSVMRCGF